MSLAGLWWLAYQGELVDPGDRDAAEGAVDRLPARAVLAQTLQDVRDRGVPAILSNALGLDHPLVTVAGPVAFAEAPLGVEDPGLELAPHRIPADPLRAAQDWPAVSFHGEFADQEVAVVGPLAGGMDDGVLALVDPFPDQPFQLLQAVVGGQVVRDLVADGRLEPVAVVLHVDGGEPGYLGHS